VCFKASAKENGRRTRDGNNVIDEDDDLTCTVQNVKQRDHCSRYGEI